MRILVLGGYGLIGAAVVRRLLADGHDVTGLGRDVSAASRTFPSARWISADIATLTEPERWHPHLDGIEAVVNCAGALQDGPRDDLAAVQLTAMVALFRAAEIAGIERLVQISAPGADPGATTTFMRTKGEADAALAATCLAWINLRPGLVIAPAAYGATALMRALAAFPLVMPIAVADARLRTVHVDDVADAVAMAVAGAVPLRKTYDLVEDREWTLAELAIALRQWLGRSHVPLIKVPRAIARAAFAVGDGLGRLGWRTPMRSTALRELERGIGGDPAPWRAATGRSLPGLEATLARLPSTVQERWYGRLWLAKPVMIATLSIFWTLTGLIALVRLDAASAHLAAAGLAGPLAAFAALATSLLDIALGLAILVRRLMPSAALGMIATSLVYLGLGTLLAPALWLDPLGPFVKVLPGMALALSVLAIAEER